MNAAAVLERSLEVAARGNPPAVPPIDPPPRVLDVVTLGEIKRKLTTAITDVQVAGLHTRGNPQARNTIAPAYQALRAALDVFEAAYKRGVL